jgi:pimeloyl-ACP methyl ester carboxylesterase
LQDPSKAPGIEVHSDDAHRLLAAVTSEPSFVFGSSIGALIALDLVARHPEQIRLLVAHEPAAIQLLPDAERVEAMRKHKEVDELFRGGNIAAAMPKMMELSGVRFDDREPDAEMPRPDPQKAAMYAANMRFLVTYDAPEAHRYRFDLAALTAARERILPAVGRTSGGSLERQSVRPLAEKLGLQVVDFPGGHTGCMLRPREFAAKLHEVFSASK